MEHILFPKRMKSKFSFELAEHHSLLKLRSQTSHKVIIYHLNKSLGIYAGKKLLNNHNLAEQLTTASEATLKPQSYTLISSRYSMINT